VLAALGQPPVVITNEYVPAAAAVALGIVGFCKVDVNPFGPDQLYVALDTVLALRLRVFPAQTGLFDDTVAEAGCAETTTFVVTTELLHPLTVIVRE
jgi:hypothetical protein